jgi:hypothetical protein
MKKTRGLYPAPLEILACVEKGLADGMEAGQEEEAVRFGRLVGSEGAKNLIRLFDAMTALKKAPKEDAPRPVKRLGVLGAGLMGEGIAAVSMGLGPVVLKDVSDEGLSRATKNLRKGLDRRVRSGGLTRLDRDRQWYGLRPTTRSADLAGCDLVIEAVFEDLELKRKVLAEFEGIIGPDAVFATNTSALPSPGSPRRRSAPSGSSGCTTSRRCRRCRSWRSSSRRRPPRGPSPRRAPSAWRRARPSSS